METADVLIDAFGRVVEEVETAVEGLSAEGLAYRPNDGSNSISWLVWHLTRVWDDHLSEIAGREQSYTADGWAQRLELAPDPHDTGFGHTPEQVASVRFDSADALLGYHRAVFAYARDYLRGIDAEELDRVIDERWDPPVTVGVRLVSVLSDALQHAGQAHYVRGLHQRLG